MRAVDLRCEHREDVPCIDDPAPRLSWALEGGAAPDRLPDPSSDGLWDSGRVESADSVDVAYGGPPLPPASEFSWTVAGLGRGGASSAERARALPHRARRVDARSWIRRDRELRPGDARPRHRRGPRRERHAAAAAVAVPRTCAAPFAVDRRRCAGRRSTRPRAAWSSWSSTATRVGDAVLAPGWTDYREADRVRGARRHRAGARRARTCSARSSATAGTPASSASTRAGRATTTASDPELLCELHLEHADGSARSSPPTRAGGQPPGRSCTPTC